MVASLPGLKPLFAAESVVILPPTRVGDSIDLVQTSIRERSVGGQVPTKGTSTTPIHLEVLAASDDATVMGWTIGRAKIEGPRFNRQVAAVTDPLVDLFAGQTIELVLDAEFTPNSIRNLDQVMTLARKTVDVLEKSLPPHITSAVSTVCDVPTVLVLI
jgi:hypothetical protein